MAEEFTCAVDEIYRSACKDLPKYSGSRYCVLHEPDESKNKEAFEEAQKSKLAQKDYDFGGTVFPEGTAGFQGFEFDANVNFRGATFVGIVNFSGAEFTGKQTIFFEAEFSGKQKIFTLAEFSGETTEFGEAEFSGESTSFSGAEFSGRRTNISGTEFSDERTSFGGAKFSGERTYFTQAKFSGEQTDFSGAKFSGERTYFFRAKFSGRLTDFSDAEFGSAETIFEEATFTKDVVFSRATFRERVSFIGTAAGTAVNLVFGSQVWFDHSRIEKPEQVTFNTVLLHPGWFINVDVRKVDFTDVKWYGMPGGPKGKIEHEIKALRERHVETPLLNLRQRSVESPHTLLAKACRRLSANAEENREYPLANEFYYWSMDALRIGRWHYLGWLRQFIEKNWRRIRAHFGLIATLLWLWRIFRRKPLRHTMPSRFGLVPTFYWALSGYGVKAGRAFLVLGGMLLAFAAMYMFLGPHKLQSVGPAVVYSLLALTRLNPEPRPEEPGMFQFLVGLEGILGPLQIALLALAIRRKVMR